MCRLTVIPILSSNHSPEFFKPGEFITATGHPPKAGGTYGMSYPEIVREDGTVIPSSLF